jgi:hypothetical protein
MPVSGGRSAWIPPLEMHAPTAIGLGVDHMFPGLQAQVGGTRRQASPQQLKEVIQWHIPSLVRSRLWARGLDAGFHAEPDSVGYKYEE